MPSTPLQTRSQSWTSFLKQRLPWKPTYSLLDWQKELLKQGHKKRESLHFAHWFSRKTQTQTQIHTHFSGQRNEDYRLIVALMTYTRVCISLCQQFSLPGPLLQMFQLGEWMSFPQRALPDVPPPGMTAHNLHPEHRSHTVSGCKAWASSKVAKTEFFFQEKRDLFIGERRIMEKMVVIKHHSKVWAFFFKEKD